jgi:hypothetical protein
LAAELIASISGDHGSETMDKWQITSRVEEIRREIILIREPNRNYKTHSTHSVSEIAKHEERQRRLQEIMVELKVLAGRPTT